MKKWIKFLALLTFILSWNACSGSKKSEEGNELGEDILEETGDADAVPKDDLEGLESAGAEDLGEEVAKAEESKPAVNEGAALEESFDDAAPADTSMADDSMSAPPTAGSGDFDNYTVRRGDTLMKIAFQYYGDVYQWRRIYEANTGKLQSPDVVPVGASLQIERPAVPVNIERNGEAFMIRVGDTLGTISQEIYGSPKKWKKLYQNNRQLVKDKNKIYAGFQLYYIFTAEDEREKQQSLGGGGSTEEVRDPAAQ